MLLVELLVLVQEIGLFLQGLRLFFSASRSWPVIRFSRSSMAASTAYRGIVSTARPG